MQSDPRAIIDQAMLMLGISNIAYIKAVKESKEAEGGYAIFAADGTQLAVLPSREAALYTARQNNFEPLSIH